MIGKIKETERTEFVLFRGWLYSVVEMTGASSNWWLQMLVIFLIRRYMSGIPSFYSILNYKVCFSFINLSTVVPEPSLLSQLVTCLKPEPQVEANEKRITHVST